MNEWMNECISEWNEWMNEWTNVNSVVYGTRDNILYSFQLAVQLLMSLPSFKGEDVGNQFKVTVQ